MLVNPKYIGQIHFPFGYKGLDFPTGVTWWELQWKLHSSPPSAWEPAELVTASLLEYTIGGGVDPEHGYTHGAHVDFRYRWGQGDLPTQLPLTCGHSDWTETLDVVLA